MKYPVALQYDSESGDWTAWCPELPCCNTSGETRDEALADIREVIAEYLDVDVDEVSIVPDRDPSPAL